MGATSPYILDRRESTTPGDSASFPFDRVEANRIFEERVVAANMSVQGVNLSAWADRIVDLEGGAGVGVGYISHFDTRTEAIAATISAQIDTLSTGGYSTAGDGGHGTYKRLGSAPTDSTNKAYFQSADGAWWALVPDSSGVNIYQFGGKADTTTGLDGTDNLTPFNDAQDYIAIAINTERNFSHTINFGVGKYRFSDTIHLHRTLNINGQCSGIIVGSSSGPTQWHFPADTTCFVFHHELSGPGEDENLGASLLGNSVGSSINGIAFHGSGTSKAKRGILMRAQAKVSNCLFYGIPGDAIYIRAQIGAVDERYGNANNWALRDNYVHSCTRHALHVYGSDTNGGSCYGFRTHGPAVTGVGGCGIYEHDNLGANDYGGLQITGYGNCGVSYGGNRYQWNGIDEGAASTTPGTNNRIWYFIGAGGVDAVRFPDWSTLDYANYIPQLPILSGGAPSVFSAMYVEVGVVSSHTPHQALLIGGNGGCTSYSNAVTAASSVLGNGQATVLSQTAIGAYRSYVSGSPGYTVSGAETYALVGADGDDGINILTHNKYLIDGGQRWVFGYRGDDLEYRYGLEKKIWEISTAGTDQTYGRAAVAPYYIGFQGFGLISTNGTTRALIRSADAMPSGVDGGRAEIVFDTVPVAGGGMGWVCVSGGNPSTYAAFGPIVGGANRIPYANASSVWESEAAFTYTATTNTLAVDNIALSGTASGITTLTTTGLPTFKSATAVPAGGAQGISMSSTAGLGVYFGSGAPTVSAAKGSLYLRTDGSGTSDRMYVNTDAGTTWTAVTTAA
jgi:hypothetical protein